MPSEFQYGVILSHSAKDKSVVRPLADREQESAVGRVIESISSEGEEAQTP